MTDPFVPKEEPRRDGVQTCGWWVGPIWKLGGETCVCSLAPHEDEQHICSCGAWFQGCGHPPAQRNEEVGR